MMCIFSEECEAAAKDWLDNTYEEEYRLLLETWTQRDWEYNTNINDDTAAASVGRSQTDTEVRCKCITIL